MIQKRSRSVDRGLQYLVIDREELHESLSTW